MWLGTTNRGYSSAVTSQFVAVNSSGILVDGGGNPIMLRGSNLSGLNDQVIPDYSGQIDPWGNGNTPSDPNFVQIAAWKMNVVRVILNVQSFLGIHYQLLTGSSNATAAWGGTSYSADPNGNYQQYMLAAFRKARSANCYIIIDCHECAPQFTLGGITQYLPAIDQSPFMDAQTASVFWTDPTQSIIAWLATYFGSLAFNTANGFNGGAAGIYYDAAHGGVSGFQDFIFELFNEPYFGNQAFTLTTIAGTFGNPAWKAHNGGSAYTTTNGGTPPVAPGASSLGVTTAGEHFVMLYGGQCNWFYQQGAMNNGRGIPAGFTVGSLSGALNQPWQVYGYQQAVTGIRALGATNVILVNGSGFASSQSLLPYYMPVDSLSPPQIGTGWHAYESGSSTYPSTLDPGSGTSSCLQYSEDNAAGTGGLGYAVPVMITEIATTSGVSNTQPDPYISRMTALTDAQALGSFHYIDFCNNNVAAYNSQGPLPYTENIYDAPVSITASISGTTLTVTVAGGTILPGMAITSGVILGAPYILPYGSGGTTGTGGTGTYEIDNPQTVGLTSMNVNAVLPWNGQGETFYDWLVGHA
jgi:hypothetical protein